MHDLEELQKRYASSNKPIVNEMETLLDNIENKTSWSDYKLPENTILEQKDLNLLLNSYFHKDEVSKISGTTNVMETHSEDEPTPEESAGQITPLAEIKPGQQITPNIADAEAFIKKVAISYISDTDVSIKAGGKEAKIFSCENIGFKQSEKTWLMFIKVLQDSDHKYHVGIYSQDKNPIKNRNYNSLMKRPVNFSKKFVSFLNETYKTALPEDLNVFKNIKGRERAGTYEPKFLIINKLDIANHEDIKKMSKEEVLKKIQTLADQRQREKDKSLKENLLWEIGKCAEHAKKRDWITEKQLQEMISNPDEAISSDDLLIQANEFEYNENQRGANSGPDEDVSGD